MIYWLCMIQKKERPCWGGGRYYLLLFLVIFAGMPMPVKALSDERLDEFAQNDIMFYDAESCDTNMVSYTADSNGSDVYIIGDSITVVSKSAIEAVLPDATIDAQSSIWFAETQAEQNLESGVDRLARHLDEEPDSITSKKILVFALGSNGGIKQSDIDRLFSVLQGQDIHVILMTIYYRDGSVSQMNRTNELVEQVANQNENVSIMDWNAVASADPAQYIEDNVHPTSPVGVEKFAETLKNAVDQVSTVNVAANAGTGDFSNILAAKNAEKSFFNGEPSELSAMWYINDEESMKRLLENYGDLAYQVYRAVNVPWVGVLVQMLGEDPYAQCGRNNFWGNGCYGEHRRVGTALIQDDTIGEGFVSYAKSLTNGNHDRALGITDPKEFLEVLGPTWIQGDPNGAGYGNIEALKRAVDALQSYIDSPEGQAIVHTFGHYVGTVSDARCCVDGATSPLVKPAAATDVKWEDGWIVDGMSGYSKVPAIEYYGEDGLQEEFGAEFLTELPNGKGIGPNKILLHATESVSNGEAENFLDLYSTVTADGRELGIPAHFTIDLKNRVVAQHGSIYQAAAAVATDEEGNGDLTAGIQIEIIGYDTKGEDSADWYLGDAANFKSDDWQYLVKLLEAISIETGIPLDSSVDWSDGAERMDPQEFKEYAGILGHKHVPGDEDHGDISERVWKKIEGAIEMGGYMNFSSSACKIDAGELLALVGEWTWKYGEENWNTGIPKESWAEVVRDRVSRRKWTGGGVTDCGGFTAAVVQESGWDTDYIDGNVSPQFQYLSTSPKWMEVTDQIHSNDDAQPGDVIIRGEEGFGHVFLFVGFDAPGFSGHSPMASASYTQHTPMEELVTDIMTYVAVRTPHYHVFRNIDPPTTYKNYSSIGDSGLTYEQAKQFMMHYGENKNDSSRKTVANDDSWFIGCNGNNRARNLGGSNCVTFSIFFLNKFTTVRYGGGDGNMLVNNLRNVKKDNEPSVWAVFSHDGPNHTGVILGRENGEWIVGNASCHGWGIGKGDGVTTASDFPVSGAGAGFVKKSSNINAAILNSGAPVQYAHPIVDEQAILDYLNTGE